MRTNLKVFRVRHQLTQEQLSANVGVDRSTYASIESGKSDGRLAFWQSLQEKYAVAPADLMELMKNE